MNCFGRKWFGKKSLVFKLSLGVLAGVLLGVALLLGIVSSRSKMIIKDQIMSHSDHSIRATVGSINHLVSETEQAVRALRNTLQQLDSNDVSSLQIALKSTIKAVYNSGLDLSHVAVYSFSSGNSFSGMLYSASAHDGKFFVKEKKINDFYALYPLLKGAEDDENIFWSEPYANPDSPDKRMVISCILPFKFQGEEVLSGLVSISIDIQDILQYIEQSPFQDGGDLVLVSKTGLYITHPNPEISLKKTIYELASHLNLSNLSQIGEKVLTGQSGYMYLPYSSVYNEPTIFFYAPVPRLDWGVCLIFSYRQLFRPVQELQVLIIISAIAVIFVLLFLINKICYYSIRPLLNIAKVATQYGKGDFSGMVTETNSDDEIGMLSTAFHNMRTNLLDYIEKEKQETSEKQKVLSELDIARKIQLSALTIDFPEYKAFQLSARMIPAKQIGGDFYDFFFVSKNRVGVVIADVSGKGISAALYMMRAKEVIKHTAKYRASITGVFEQVNNILCEGNSICMFVSAFLGIINLKTGVMEYVNAGHLPPFLISRKKCQKIMPTPNFVLGVKENLSYKTEKIKLLPDDCLFLYTDGITEAENSERKFYGEERLQNILKQYSGSPTELVDTVMADIKGYAQDTLQSDDITMLVFHYRGQNSDTLTVDADIKKLGFVLEFIEQDMQEKGIPQEIRPKIIVAAEELFSNIALYAYEAGGEAEIKTALSKDKYSLKFTDKGRPYNPLDYQEPDVCQSLETRPVGGLGIFIAKKMTDFISYSRENGKNVLKVEVKLK